VSKVGKVGLIVGQIIKIVAARLKETLIKKLPRRRAYAGELERCVGGKIDNCKVLIL
jgi:hypothetical protein